MEMENNEISVVRMQTRLDQLPDNCLLAIFTRIGNFKEYLTLTKVCRRFRNLLRDQFPNYIHMSFMATQMIPNAQDIVYYMRLMKSNISQLQLMSNGQLRHYCELSQIRELHNVKRCVMRMGDNEEGILKMTELLPNLEILTIGRPISGCHLWNFKWLTTLIFSKSCGRRMEIEQVHLRAICENLTHLENLDIRHQGKSKLSLKDIQFVGKVRYFALNLSTLQTNLSMVLEMPFLTTIIVYYDLWSVSILNEAFFELLRVHGATLRVLSVNAERMFLHYGWDEELAPILLQHKTLRSLHVNGWDDSGGWLYNYVTLTSLEKLSCCCWYRLDATSLLLLVSNCTKLRAVDLCGTTIVTNTLRKDIYRIILKNLSKEKQELHNFHLIQSSADFFKYSYSQFYGLDPFITFLLEFDPLQSKTGMKK